MLTIKGWYTGETLETMEANTTRYCLYSHVIITNNNIFIPRYLGVFTSPEALYQTFEGAPATIAVTKDSSGSFSVFFEGIEKLGYQPIFTEDIEPKLFRSGMYITVPRKEYEIQYYHEARIEEKEIETLEHDLEKALQDEDYDYAAMVRDELKKLKKNRAGH
ncbi:MAG: UvrB/UvrC motif-containing protein [Candidatus Pacebacteria bacterium]|nr:UvrB/UvrC motif-containing protein [Candidatus Paceibacterota bacterium]